MVAYKIYLTKEKMAVPKKRKSSSATKRQRNAYVISQHKKILKMVDARKRVEKNLEKMEANEGAIEYTPAKTVIAA
ncbi:TPA: hypothetical protein EYG84_03230 [Candidatus Gracilibacteria bacterium]|nr:hypothetical protein [Candidatus Gracilibacteria bacterium]